MMEENKTYTRKEINQILKNSLDKFFPKDSTLRTDFDKEVCNQFKELDGPKPNDLVTTTPDDWIPTEYVVSVNCPHCGKHNDTYRYEIPSDEIVVTCSHCSKSYRIYCGW